MTAVLNKAVNRGYGNTRRLQVIFVVVALVLLAVGTTSPARAQAIWDPGCNSASRTWAVQEGSVSINIGHVHAWVTRCWDTHGYLSSSSSDVWSDLTGYGWSIGYHINPGPTNLVWSSHTSAGYSTSGEANECVVLRVSLCGFAEYFRVDARVYAPNFFGPYGPTFVVRCTNSKCALKFK